MADREMPPTKHGHSPWDCVSALQKSIRRSDPEAACYWAIELVRAGYGPWMFARLRVIAMEDVSPGATGLFADIAALHEQWKKTQGKRDDLLPVTRAVIALAIAPKSRVADWLVLTLTHRDAPRREVPDEAHDQHTWQGKRMGRGWAHFLAEGGKLIDWTGDLAELELEHMERWRRITETANVGADDESPIDGSPGAQTRADVGTDEDVPTGGKSPNVGTRAAEAVEPAQLPLDGGE